MGLSFKTAAWNGIFLNIPRSWEAGVVDTHYLVFEKNAKPVMEIKWQRVKGRFSAKSHLKRLAGLHGRRKKIIRPWQPHASWLDALNGFKVDGFQWQGQDDAGRGVILWCPHCRTASLIQFLGAGNDVEASAKPEILAGFGDHREDDQILWSLFDIRIVIPKSFVMREFAFQPGCYRFTFEKGGISLILFRWAPAAALLTGQRLADFAAGVLKKDPRDFNEISFNGYPAIAWKSRHGFFRRWHRFRSTPGFFQGRVWHIESHNRILGVHMLAKKPLEDSLLDKICGSYEAIS